MGNVLKYKEGRGRIVEKIRDIEKSRDISKEPILVGIYGQPNSGKSYLMNDLRNNFFKNIATCRGGASSERDFEYIRDNYVGSLHFFHCGWERIILPNGVPVSEDADPGHLAKKVLGRDVDFNVGIYGSNLYNRICGEYDFVISNENSVKKKL